MSIFIKAALALAVLWGLVLGIMWTAGFYEVTPEKVKAYLEAQPMSELDGASRARRIEEVANRLNQLDYRERRSLREGENAPLPAFFDSLTAEEKIRFVDLTMGSAFDAMMKAFNEMDPEERRRIAEDAIEGLKRDRGRLNEERELGDAEIAMLEKITNEGLRAFYEEASAETKMDLAPVLEEMQRTVEKPGGRWKRGKGDSKPGPAY